MSRAVRFARDGRVLDGPRRARAPRVFVEGGHAQGYAISSDGLRILRDDSDARRQFLSAAVSFRAWLDCWQFLDQETGLVRVLGQEVWPAQQAYITVAEQNAWIYALKGRQLGLTEVAVAHDAWVARFRDPNARVHVFSSGDDAAKEVLDRILFGLERLPPALRLPLHATTRSIRLDTGAGGRALIRSYPSTRAASRGSTCGHLHLDEWSAQVDPLKVLQAVTPSVAPGGSFAIVTTETLGPESVSADYFRKCEAGDGKHEALFVSSLERPGRDETWLEGMRRSMPPDQFRREYPTTWQEALEASGERYFESTDIDAADVDANGLGPARTYIDRRGKERPFRYVVGVDIGFRQDATAIIVLELSDEGHDVVHYRYLKGASPTEVQGHLEHVAQLYPKCFVLIEDNGPGYVVRTNLDLREDRVEGFTTSQISKSRVLDNLYAELRAQTIKWPHADCPELTREMYACRADKHTGDAVIALALALEAGRLVRERGPGTWSVLRV